MATFRRKTKPAPKLALMTEAGGKCANPGCTNWRTHIHHIKHWAVYHADDPAHMIAICPSCHDDVHHGRLIIADAALYSWKAIGRPERPDSFQMYVDPAMEQKLLLGSVCVQSASPKLLLAQLTKKNSVGFRVVDGRFLQVSMRVYTLSGRELLHVTDNIVQVPHSDEVTFDARNGKVRVTVPATDDFIPPWVITGMWNCDRAYGSTGRVVALDIEVLKPGLVRLQGYWPSDEDACVVTEQAFVWVTRRQDFPAIVVGHGSHGEDTVFLWKGDGNSPMFRGIYSRLSKSAA